MPKIEIEAYWDGKDLKFTNPHLVREQMDEFQPGPIDMTAEEPFQWKTNEQLGYLFGEIAIKAMIGYRRIGVNVKNKEMAIAKLSLEEDIDFCEYITDTFTNDVIARIPKRLSSASRKQINQFMTDAIIFIEENLGEIVETPEEYKERKYGNAAA